MIRTQRERERGRRRAARDKGVKPEMGDWGASVRGVERGGDGERQGASETLRDRGAEENVCHGPKGGASDGEGEMRCRDEHCSGKGTRI
jgi:hypothetical protein